MLLIVGAGAAVAQISQDPKVSAVKNNSPLGNLGSRISIAEIFMILAIITVGLLALMYIRNAPRFASDEDGLSVVRADRVVGGQAPRRAVDVSQAVPIVVAPPAVPSAAAAAPPAAPASPATAAPAPSATPADAAPAAEARATAAAEAVPAADTAPAAAPPPPAAPPAARPEVSLDQEVFDKKLEELLAAGTDRRVAEGQARRAAMIAARKKAEAEGAG
ncbi:MAG: hypothetical protein QOI52_1832 [Chloroflexota bacterium]|nr:hypothetical protein [Chloroflexota bacterium]